ncbi:hypothetical protein QQF64_002390 [Cirrhinus molitorella]|uniref:EF-hand domain-containing protein n=1 Tax=Cirrhinus molitorella TaxID=172907 RepID=A0ABR3MQ11_9TELE
MGALRQCDVMATESLADLSGSTQQSETLQRTTVFSPQHTPHTHTCTHTHTTRGKESERRNQEKHRQGKGKPLFCLHGHSTSSEQFLVRVAQQRALAIRLIIHQVGLRALSLQRSPTFPPLTFAEQQSAVSATLLLYFKRLAQRQRKTGSATLESCSSHSWTWDPLLKPQLSWDWTSERLSEKHSGDDREARMGRTSRLRCRQGVLKLIQSLQRLVSGTLSKDKIDDELEMTMVCHRPEGLEQLEAQTNFTKQELQVLYRGFKNECPSGVVNEETFKHIYAQFFPHGDASTYAHYLFNAFDTRNNGSIKFEDFVMGLSTLLRGTVRDKLEWTFHLYDINRDGLINKEEMTEIVRAIYDMMGKYTYPALKGDVPKQHVDAFFEKMDKNKDGVVTLEEFVLACQEDENMMRSMQLFENVM